MKKRVLIVDDETAFVNSLQRDLRCIDNKFDIHTTTNSNDTLKMINELNIDLLITDLLMPNKEGIEIIMETKEKFPLVKIIAMSGGHKINLKFAIELGSDYALEKPFSRDELITAIKFVFHE